MKDIPGFPDYAITRDGRVWSKPRKDSKGCFRKGRWLKLHLCGKGYLFITLYKKQKIHYKYPHRLVLETYVGPCPKGMECRHLDGNPLNNNLDNLKWGTYQENKNDSVKHGTIPPNQMGSNNYCSKLTEMKVKVIRYLYSTRLFTQKDIAWQFDVSPGCITLIIRGKRWGWLK